MPRFLCHRLTVPFVFCAADSVRDYEKAGDFQLFLCPSWLSNIVPLSAKGGFQWFSMFFFPPSCWNGGSPEASLFDVAAGGG
jgi:hypothetical protein